MGKMKRKIKATRQPLWGFDVDWIIEEKTNHFICAIKRARDLKKYPYNKVFKINLEG